VPPVPGRATNYVLSSWKQVNTSDHVTIHAPANIYVSGDVKINGGTVDIVGASATSIVRWYINGNFSQAGGSFINNPGGPSGLYISMTGSGSAFDSSAQLSAHIYAPLSDVTIHGNNTNADFFGWIVSNTLTVKGNVGLHYDETRGTVGRPFQTGLVSSLLPP